MITRCVAIKLRSSAMVTANCWYPSAVSANTTTSSSSSAMRAHTASALSGVMITHSMGLVRNGGGSGNANGVFSKGTVLTVMGFSLGPNKFKLAQPDTLIDSRLKVRICKGRTFTVDLTGFGGRLFCFSQRRTGRYF
jgi:hypothetical protein